MTIGERIKQIRKAESLTLEKFGEKVGVTKGAMSAIENGIRGLTDQMFRSICREFNVNPEWLRNGEGEMFLQLSRSEELSAFLGDVLRENGFRARLITALSKLSPEEWALVEDMARKLQDDAERDAP